METTPKWSDGPNCNCTHSAPPERVVRSTYFNQGLAQFYVGLGLSGDATIDWVLNELYDHRAGALIGLNGQSIEIEAVDANGTTLFDDLFGADERRFITRFRVRASRGFRYRLQRRCLFPVLMMHFAREIHLCRTQNTCAN
jgi:hypothetical protein